MKIYKIRSKDDETLVAAADRDHAYAKYFRDIIARKVPLERLGNIIVLEDRGAEYPFRTVPLLWRLGVIDDELAVENIQRVIDTTSREEARLTLEACASNDERLIPLIRNLELRVQGHRNKGHTPHEPGKRTNLRQRSGQKNARVLARSASEKKTRE